MIALLDADLFVYRVGFAADKEPWGICKSRLDSLIGDILLYIDDCEDHLGFLTEGSGNYRNKIAVTHPYKGGRPERKPTHYNALRDYLVDSWGCQMETEQEADDAIGIAATLHSDGSCIVTIDKDLDNVPGNHYNFVKGREYYVTEEEASQNFYTQLLVGDRTDNVHGIYGIGPKTAAKILEGAKDPKERYFRVLEEYDGDEARVLENGRLLWIRHYPNELWGPPK